MVLGRADLLPVICRQKYPCFPGLPMAYIGVRYRGLGLAARRIEYQCWPRRTNRLDEAPRGQ